MGNRFAFIIAGLGVSLKVLDYCRELIMSRHIKSTK